MDERHKTRRVIRISRVTGDGEKTPGHLTLILKDPVTANDLLNDDGSPAATMQLRPIDEDERRAVVQEHTRLEKDPNGGRGLFEYCDAGAANDELLCRAIVSWDGLVGSDDRPLVCTRATKLVLDNYIRGQVTRKLFGSEVVEVLAASFR